MLAITTVLLILMVFIMAISGFYSVLYNESKLPFIICVISLLFTIGIIVYSGINYKDTRRENCLSLGGTYVDIPGKRGCIYGVDKE